MFSEEFWHKVFDILESECGAHSSERPSFLMHMQQGCDEFRCCWKLGFGGKIYSARGKLRVDTYPEEMTTERARIIEKVNGLLKELIQAQVKPK